MAIELTKEELDDLNRKLMEGRTKIVEDYYKLELSINELLGKVQKILKTKT